MYYVDAREYEETCPERLPCGVCRITGTDCNRIAVIEAAENEKEAKRKNV